MDNFSSNSVPVIGYFGFLLFSFHYNNEHFISNKDADVLFVEK